VRAAASPRIPRSVRPVLRALHWRHLLRRQVAWILTTACIGAFIVLISPVSHLALWVALALGLGAAASIADRWTLGLVVAAATVAAAVLWHVVWASGSTLLNGTTLMIIGGVTGAGVVRWVPSAGDAGTTLLGALSGAVGAGAGWASAQAWVPTDWPSVASALAIFGLTGLATSASLWVSTIEWRSADRMPSHMRIRQTLRDPFQAGVLAAWRRDRQLARVVGDPDTRDGLGEVGAWIYRLSMSLQDLDDAIAAIDAKDIQTRIDTLETEAKRATDAFTRDRTRAAAGHLIQLCSHRDALAIERDRMSALLLYAEAFLEEAEAGLAIARVHPGEQIPDRLTDVLSRLRDDATASDSRRRTTRELVALS